MQPHLKTLFGTSKVIYLLVWSCGLDQIINLWTKKQNTEQDKSCAVQGETVQITALIINEDVSSSSLTPAETHNSKTLEEFCSSC